MKFHEAHEARTPGEIKSVTRKRQDSSSPICGVYMHTPAVYGSLYRIRRSRSSEQSETKIRSTRTIEGVISAFSSPLPLISRGRQGCRETISPTGHQKKLMYPTLPTGMLLGKRWPFRRQRRQRALFPSRKKKGHRSFCSRNSLPSG